MIIPDLVRKMQLQSYLEDTEEERQRRQKKGDIQNMFPRVE
jgi:hypothetical protein